MTPTKIGKFTIDSGKHVPPRYVIYGAGSVGKTTLAASAPAPLFVCVEDGAREFDVPRVKFDDAAERYYPANADEVADVLEAIAKGGAGDRETLVLDGAHQLDILLQEKTLKENPKWKSIQEAGFGKGEAEVLNKWRPIVSRLDEINTRRSMRIVLLGHQQIIKFKDPEGPEYDRYDLMVSKHPKGDVAGFLYGWADVFAFARFESLTQEAGKRTIAVAAQGERTLQLRWTNAFQAKSRIGGPEAIHLSAGGVARSWIEVFGEIEHKAPEVLKASITALLGAVDEDTRASVTGWLAKVGDNPRALSQGLESLKKKAQKGQVAA